MKLGRYFFISNISRENRLKRLFCQEASLEEKTKPILFAKDFRFTLGSKYQKESELTPVKIFDLLEKKVVGQQEAKRTLAIAYSNNY